MASIIMVHTLPGAPDHIHTRMYQEGEVYEIGSEFMPEDFANVFLSEGYATSLPGEGVPIMSEKGAGTPPEQPLPRQGQVKAKGKGGV